MCAQNAGPMEEHAEEVCPVELAARLVGDKWILLIVRDLADGCRRFGELQKSVHGISPRTLSDRLSVLEKAGLVERRQYPEIPPRVEYSLTDKGRGLIPVIDAIRAYGMRWLVEDASKA